MKHLFTIILSLLLLTACGERERVQFEKLQQIDSIAEVNADSVVTMLKEHRHSMTTMSLLHSLHIKHTPMAQPRKQS